VIALDQHDPLELGVVAPTGLPPVAVPPSVRDVAEVSIADDGSPLVALDDVLPCRPLYHLDGWPGAPSTSWARAEVAERLAVAADALPPRFRLVVWDAWRSPVTIRALYDHFYGPGSTLPPGFLADPDDPSVVPPHLTGGAVDLTLSWDGRALALGTCFDDFSPLAAAAAFEAPGADPLVRDLRRLLHHVLGEAGFVGLAEEWWHVSWGDQAWAARAATPTTAPFGPTAPPTPTPEL